MLTAVPNPARDELSVDFTVPNAEPCSLMLLDLKGTLVTTFFSKRMLNGSQHHSLPLSSVPSGNYLLQLQSPWGVRQTKLIIQR
jgi:hypothetical protein